MTYHMETRTRSKSRRSLDFPDSPENFEDPQNENLCPVSTKTSEEEANARGIPWPRKLWEIASDPKSDMIVWTEEGTGISVDDVQFEMSVMDVYPGFVQLPTFLNLRRQLRAYSFTWKTCSTDRSRTSGITFHHPYFIRGHPELLPYVVTKRKRNRDCCRPPPCLKKFALEIQEANRWDLPLPPGLELESFSVFDPEIHLDFSVPIKKPRNSGQLIQKAAKICEIPGSCSSPLVRDLANTSHAPLDVHPSNHPEDTHPLPTFSEFAKGGYWPEVPTTMTTRIPCDIPIKFWNDPTSTDIVPLPSSAQYEQPNVPGPYPYYPPFCDPYGYYQYPHPNAPWPNYEHGPEYFSQPPACGPSTSNTTCNPQPEQPSETSSLYPVPCPDQVPQFGYYHYPGHVTNVTDSVQPKCSPKVEPKCDSALSNL